MHLWNDHVIYDNKESDILGEFHPIKDQHDDVVLDQCMVCGKAEADLSEKCLTFKEGDSLNNLKTTLRAIAQESFKVVGKDNSGYPVSAVKIQRLVAIALDYANHGVKPK